MRKTDFQAIHVFCTNCSWRVTGWYRHWDQCSFGDGFRLPSQATIAALLLDSLEESGDCSHADTSELPSLIGSEWIRWENFFLLTSRRIGKGGHGRNCHLTHTDCTRF